jgi:hypothetical protein
MARLDDVSEEGELLETRDRRLVASEFAVEVG